MDVNELIDKYQEFLELNISAVGGSVFRMSDLLNDLKELSNLEYNRKVKVPEFVAKWIEIMRENEPHGKYWFAYNLHAYIKGELNGRTKEWFDRDTDNVELVIKAILYGYEVEEETWEVRLKFNDKEAAEAYAHVECGEVVKIESC